VHEFVINDECNKHARRKDKKNIDILILPDVSVDRGQKCGALGDAIFFILLIRVFAIGGKFLTSVMYLLHHCSWSAALCKAVSVNGNKHCRCAGLCTPSYKEVNVRIASTRAPHFLTRSTLTSGSINILIFLFTTV